MHSIVQCAASVGGLSFTTKDLLAVVLILGASALCGRLAIWIGQPRVLGEMVAGVLLGPSLLGVLAPHFESSIFSAQAKPVLSLVSTIGLTLFMFLVGVGLEGGEAANNRQGSRSGILAVCGFFPTLALGGAVGWALYGTLSRPDVPRYEFAMFVGGALAVTAFPMLARILYERSLQNTQLGRLSLLAASVDDVAAWCFLAFLIALHNGGGVIQALRTLAFAVVFTGLMLIVVSRLLRPLGRYVERTGELGFDGFYLVLGIALLSGLFTDAIGIYSVFGGFVAGVSMPKNKAFRELVHGRVMEVTCILLLPVFFTLSGLNTRLDVFDGWRSLLLFLVILAAAFVGKYFGCAAAMRGMGFSWREAYGVGGLMNSRGLMILVFINVGLSDQIITQKLFSMLVLVAVVTTAAALPLYRLAVPKRMEESILMAAGVLPDVAVIDCPGPASPGALESLWANQQADSPAASVAP